MIDVYLVSGFLGAGKTTFIKYLLKSAVFNKPMLIENEFGEVGIDGTLFSDKLRITELNNGCICCSLKGKLNEVLALIPDYQVETLFIEPSGVGKLSEIIPGLQAYPFYRIVSHLTLIDAKKALSYHKNFKAYFDDQIVAAGALVLTKSEALSAEKKAEVLKLLASLNPKATLIKDPYDDLPFDTLLTLIQTNNDGLATVNGTHAHHHADFSSLTIKPSRPYSAEEVAELAHNLAKSLLRAKGYLTLNDGLYYFDLAGDGYTLTKSKLTHEPILVLIGKELDEAYLRSLFK